MPFPAGSERSATATLALALLATGCATPRSSLLTRFEATLAMQDSATAALGQWCAARGLADPATVTARTVSGQDRPPTPADRHLLGADTLGYRHVRLSCGGRVLSQAHNWYVPARLTSEMNAALAMTDTPFGKVAAPLRFTRQRLSATRGRGVGCPAGTILTHRALLRLPDGAPLALVVECYTRANVG